MAESIQNKLYRARYPRVQITYDVELYGAVQKKELPFVVGILSDLSGNGNQQTISFKERKFIGIDFDNFNSVINKLKPCLVFEVNNKLGVDDQILAVTLHFACMDDFNPGNVAAQIKPLRDLLEERSILIGKIFEDAANTLAHRVQEIDLLLSSQLNEILHNKLFQQLEASWRGLHFLVTQTETSELLQLRILNVSKTELIKDLNRSVEFDQSILFKKLYEDEFGAFGGRPYGLLIGDYEFGKEPADLYLLDEISHIAAAMHAPFIAAAGASLFGLESLADLANPRDLLNIFMTVDYAKWRLFRESEDAKYIALALPRILMRRPYNEHNPVDTFNFQEQTNNHNDFLWGNAAYVLASCITN